jgi:UDP-2,3-diacylglucosamine pyrophosphatase LpxH
LDLARSEKDWIFVSDAHFTGRDTEAMEAFLRFLDSEKKQMGHLVILGDLFEFFFGFKNYFSAEKSSVFTDYLPVFNKLQSLYREGIQIKYFEGNHDFFLHSFFSEQFGMEVDVYPDGCEERLEGKRISRRVAQTLSDMSYQKYHHDAPSAPPSAFKTFAHQKFLEGFEVVILGHSHFPEEIEEWIDGKKCFYYNVGDWMIHRSFLRFILPDRFKLDRFLEG